MIDFNYYKVFYYVAKFGNFSLAAKELGVSQPAISYTISELEKTISMSLFIRRGKKIELTKTGIDLLEYVEDSFNTLKMAEDCILNKTANESYKLSFGVQSYLFNALNSLKEQLKIAEKNKFRIIDDTCDNLIKKVENKELEFAIVAGTYLGKLNHIEISTLHMCFVSKNNIKLSNHDFNKFSFALPLNTTQARKEINKCLSKNGIQINPMYEFNSNQIALSLMNDVDAIFYVAKELIPNNVKFNILKSNFDLPTIPISIIYNEKYVSHEAKVLINNILNQ